jgi:hypothetical protein
MRDYIPLSHEVREQTPQEIEQRRAAASAASQKLIDDRIKREAAQQAARDAADRERGAAELGAYRERSLAAVLAAGGTPSDFEQRVWPDMKAEYLKARAVEGMTARERRVEELYQRMKGGGPQR